MVTLCYKCSQRKAVVDAKLRARSGGVVRADSETLEFEAYLYQQSPLCGRCTVLVQGTSRDSSHDVTSCGKSPRQSKACTLALIAATLILVTALILICIFYESVVVYLTTTATLLQKYTSSVHSDVTRLSHDVIKAVRDVTASSVNATGLESVLELGEGFYPADINGIIYSIVLAIQVTTIVLRQHQILSIALSLISYTIYKLSYLTPEQYSLYYRVLRYCLLSFSVLILFTRKTTVVTVSQRKNTPKPVIKVRRSPKKREASPLAPNSALFSDDEDMKPKIRNRGVESPANLSLLFNSSNNQSTFFNTSTNQNSMFNTSANLSAMFNTSANQSGVFGPRATPPGTPLKDVSSKFDIMKISGSPVKTPKPIISERTPMKRHLGCLKPARFSLDRPLPAESTTSQTPDPLEAVRPRFDSTCSEEDKTQPQPVEPAAVPNDALPVKPILLVLVLSVVTNYYLFVKYVLAS